jgi:tRNA A-37 threonylcarbamoyl transferase component Bud32
MNYEKLERIGEGANAVVFRAMHRPTRRLRALKVFKQRVDDPRLAEKFEDECTHHGRLDHANIVKVLDAGVDTEGRPFIAMELCERGSLATWLGHDQMRNPDTAAQFIAKAARTVHFGHEQGIVHRDIKPANILLNREGEPQLTDFGLATVLGLEGADASHVLGTISYMAPEQCGYQLDGECKIDRGTDVYALGLVLYELVSGKRPYAGPDKSACVSEPSCTEDADRRRALAEVEHRRKLFENHVMPCPLSKLTGPRFAIGRRPDRDLDRIVEGVLAINRFDRYSSAEKLALDLERWVAGEPTHGAGDRNVLQQAAALFRSQVLLVCILATLLASLIGAVFIGEALIADHAAMHQTSTQGFAELMSLTVSETIDNAKEHVRRLAAHEFPAEILRTQSPPPSAAMQNQAPPEFLALKNALERLKADQFYLLDKNGCILRYWPTPAPSGVFTGTYFWRHYYECAAKLGPNGGACVSRVYKSEYDHNADSVGTLRTAISAPVFDIDGKTFLGVMVAAWDANHPFGNLPLGPSHPFETQLLLARDHERAEAMRQLQGLTLPKCSARPDERVPLDVPLTTMFDKLQREPKILAFPSSGLKTENILDMAQVQQLAGSPSFDAPNYVDPQSHTKHPASLSSKVPTNLKATLEGKKRDATIGIVASTRPDLLDGFARKVRVSYALVGVVSLILALSFVLTRSRTNRRR